MADNLHEHPFGNKTLTAGHLFAELVAIANINQSFRQGKQDYVQQVHIQTDSTGLMKVADDLAKAHGDNIPETKEVKTKEDDIVSQFDWEGFERVNKDNKPERDLKLAYEVLESLKKAFREQLGMDIRPTFPRPKDKG